MTDYEIRRRQLLSGVGDFEYIVIQGKDVICRRLSAITPEEAEREIAFVKWRRTQDEIERKKKVEIPNA